MKTHSQIEEVLLEWWAGLDKKGAPLELWKKLGPNRMGLEMDDLGAMLTAAKVAKYAVRVRVADDKIEIQLLDKPDSPVVDSLHQSVPPTVIIWTPPPPGKDDPRTIMDVRYGGRSHRQHLEEIENTRKSNEQARFKMEELKLIQDSKNDRSMRNNGDQG